MQLDMFATFDPPPAAALTPDYWKRPRRTVQTRAYGETTELTIYEDEPKPFEIEVLGIPCLVSSLGSFCTYTVQPAGSLFWSDSGFRSFGGRSHDPNEIRATIARFVEQPASKGGCGGKLVRWWPGWISQWRGMLAFELRVRRENTWDQWGPEKQAEHWAAHDARQAAAIERMWAEGIDPNDVGPPDYYRGRWPTFERTAA